MRTIKIKFLLISLITLIETEAQVKKDTVEKKSNTKKAFREGNKLISTSPQDTIIKEKSIDAYSEYAGRIIRNINIERIGFEKSISTAQKK